MLEHGLSSTTLPQEYCTTFEEIIKEYKLNNVQINDNVIERKLYNNQPVITFKDIDLVHQRPEGTASRNFKQRRVNSSPFCLGKNKKNFKKCLTYGRPYCII